MVSFRTFRRRFIPLALASSLILMQFGCASTTPRRAWWQFWRPKTVKTAEDSMQPLSYEIPGESSGDLEPITIEPLSGGVPRSYADLSDEEYARLMDQPMDEPRREAAAGEARLNAVHFGFDRFDLDDQAQATLESNLDWLRRHPDTQVQIEGHTDERGTLEYNLLLGERRAKAVKAYLVSRGVAEDRLHPISYGEERPVDAAKTETAYSLNRRAQFLAY